VKNILISILIFKLEENCYVIAMKKIIISLIVFSLICSCVPNKNLIYFQGTPSKINENFHHQSSPYKLQSGDNIIIDIKSDDNDLISFFLKSNTPTEPELLHKAIYSIDAYGYIRIPILGEINVLGYTTHEVRLKLEEKFKTYYKEEVSYFISVRLDGIKYTVMGEINQPGPKVVYQNQLSILDAITNSGDIPITGNKKKVEVIRISYEETKKYTIDLTSIEAVNSEVFYLKNNDYINIPPLKQKTWGTTTGIGSLSNVVQIFSLIVTSTILILSR